MSKKLRKAVFPVAGLGTRLLPATKAIPKELLTVVDRPLIQYAVDEAREAGIEQLIFVTGRGKSALVDYFDMAFELETTMREKGKSLGALDSSRVSFGELVSVRQQQPLGLGHAVWCAREIVGNEPFAVLLPDDLMYGKPGALKQMVNAWEKVGGFYIFKHFSNEGVQVKTCRDGRTVTEFWPRERVALLPAPRPRHFRWAAPGASPPTVN